MSKSKNIVLTGATGFLGSHLLEALLKYGHKVVVIKRSTSDVWRIDHLLKNIKWIDIDKHALDDAFADEKIDAVIHTACHYGRDGEFASYVAQTNVIFSLQMLEAATKFKVPVFFNTDSFFNAGGVVQGYMNYYTLTKKHFVDWLQVFSDKINIVNLRLQHIYGANDSDTKFVTWLLKNMQMDISSIALTKGLQRRDFIYVEDVVSAYLCLLEVPNNNPFVQYDVGTGQLSTVKIFVETMRSELEIQRGIEIKPTLDFGGIPCRDGEIEDVQVDPTKLKSLGWKPKYNLSDGLKKTISATLLNSYNKPVK